MDRRFTWPDFRREWIVHEDDDLLVVDKPEGVPSQAAEPELADDVVTRLRAFLGGAYLGVHQRLDRDTSGLLVYARRPEANRSLAAQFEGRRLEKTYVACVSGWPRGRDEATLRGDILPGDGKRMRVAPPGRSGGSTAVTRVRVLGRAADRAMLELRLETGRTHQARVQLAHEGAPIAGDVLYGGARAGRLLLHASALGLEHPSTGRAVRFVSTAPADFEGWLRRGDAGEGVYDDEAALGRALGRAVERRWGLGRSAFSERATTAFRLVNDEGDALPRLLVDVYDEWLVAQLLGDDGPWADPARRERVLDALHRLGFEGVYLKVRPKQANVLTRLSAEDRLRSAPPEPVRGRRAPDELTVFESGIPLQVRLGDGLSTGVFLDQRANRRRLMSLAAGKRVANLFAYTCAFTVAAALGGAGSTVSVDASAAVLERGRNNLARAGGLGDHHAFVAEDVFAWLERTARRGAVFDLVVLDPPTYSKTKRGRFVASDDYERLAASALAIVAPGGTLLACTNQRGVSRARFRRTLFEAARAARREVTQMKDGPAASDHPPPPGGEERAKSVWVTVA